MNYQNYTKEALQAELEACLKDYEVQKNKGLSLDLSRGKPSSEQLNLSNGVLDTLTSQSNFILANGMDVRNYGGLEGIPEARTFFADVLDTKFDNIMVAGNSSLTLEYSIMSHAMTDGLCGEKPWMFVEDRKWLCPAPGYDRHFAITEHFGFELITVPMTLEGPDMDVIESLVANDASIKGVWCVPKYQNPMGITFSDEVVKRFAALKPAAKDFRIFWDNAYCVHDFYSDRHDELLDIISEAEKAGNPDIVYEFTSTSKMAFPGGGITGFAASVNNIKDVKSYMTYATIGPDKINQLRQVLYFKDKANVMKHMQRLADVIRPKFELTLDIFDKELEGRGIAKWTKPLGGYFISFDTFPGCATKIVKMCKDAGVTFTGAGATYPYGRNPNDDNIRVAPSYATIEDIKPAVDLFVLCVKIVSIEKILADKA